MTELAADERLGIVGFVYLSFFLDPLAGFMVWVGCIEIPHWHIYRPAYRIGRLIDVNELFLEL